MPARDKEMFMHVYVQFADAIYRHCFFRIFSKSRAEELTHDAFFKLWEYIEKGNTIENPRALLYRIADHLIIDEKRKRTAESLDMLMEEQGFDPPEAGHKKIEIQALYQEALRGLSQLNERERKLILYRYVDDLDPHEIAELMGTSANVISVTLNRVMKKLKKILHAT